MSDTTNNSGKPKKSFFKTLSNLVYEEDTTTSEETTNSTAASSNAQPNKFQYSETTQSTNIPSNLGIPNVGGTFDEKFYNSFLHVLENNNIEGVDYLEFSKAKKAMDNIPGMAEAVKYQSTYASLKANSTITKEQLLKTADFYIEKLENEGKEFDVEMQNEISAQVHARNEQSKSKEAEIVKKQEDIAKLQNEINVLNAEIGQSNVEAQQFQAKIDSTAKNFKITLEAVKGQINLDKQNIQTYIQ